MKFSVEKFEGSVLSLRAQNRLRALAVVVV